VLRQGKYEPPPADPAGMVRSDVFPGLWLDVPAMLQGDLASVLAGIDRGVESAEHADFVQRLTGV
jgi:hypothetical protein